LRPAGNQVLANIYKVADLARAFELSGGISFRGFVEELTAQAERAAGAGVALSHFDSHHNVHLHPAAAAALAGVARRMNVRWVRFRGQRPMLPALLREAGLLSLRDHARHLQRAQRHLIHILRQRGVLSE
jgi:predicted glycoside hydrolase/deacetylase ChbG (UPF0249 family)